MVTVAPLRLASLVLTIPVLSFLLAVSLLTGCSDSTGPGVARVQVRITDAPADAIASAEVWISRVYLQGGEGEGDGVDRVDLFNDPENPRYYDLLTLTDGITADLTQEMEVPEGSYAQLRLVVDGARVTLTDSYTFTDGTREANLFVPSGSRSGIKVQLDENIDAQEGELTIVLVDFDVEDNFVLQGAGQGSVVNGVIFTPTLTEKGRSGG